MRPDELEHAVDRDGRTPHRGSGAVSPSRPGLRSYVLSGALTAVVAAAAALGVSSAQPQDYRASAELLLRSPAGLATPLAAGPGDPERDIQTQVQLLLSPPVGELVRRRLGEQPAVEVVPVGRSDILEVMARATNPSRAAAVANAYTDAYLEYRADASQQILFTAEGEVRRQATALAQQVQAVEDGLTGATGTSRAALLATRNQLAVQQTVFAERAADLRLQSALASSGPQILARATPPLSGTRTDPVRLAAIGAVLGLFLGIGLAAALAERGRRRDGLREGPR
jgi:uncharacterized protein involved in exopolysaccharide biosynthesis